MKNTLGPEIVDDLRLEGFVRDFFSGYDGDPVEVPIELAREVVLGLAGYARSLGFDPHPDFAAAEGHLGPWTGPGAITFGKDGKPLYNSGPYDDPRPVIRTLERTVGRGTSSTWWRPDKPPRLVPRADCRADPRSRLRTARSG